MALSEERRLELGDRLRELRAGRPQRVISDRIGVTERTYGAWERGEQGIQWDHLEEVADYYQVSTNFLLYGSENRPENVGNQLDRIEAELSRQGEILDALREATAIDHEERAARAARRAQRSASGSTRAADHRRRA